MGVYGGIAEGQTYARTDRHLDRFY